MTNYIAAGFDPARFWELTPRLYVLEMESAAEKVKRERAMVWWGAMMPHLKKPPSFDEFTGASSRAVPERDWQADLAAWRAYADMRH